jgi:SAM-dependent methyltransferase
LAGRGLATTVVDIAPSGLALAEERAAAEGLRLHTLVWDLDDGVPEGRWDVVLVSFFLVRPLLAQLHRVVAPGGVLIHLHPTRRNLERHGRPGARWLLEDGELRGVPGLETLHLEEGWGLEGRHEVRYVGRRAG